MSVPNADLVRLVFDTIRERAYRERLWGMPLQEIDLETLAEKIVEALRLEQGHD